jgi:NDP-mannose synthase
MKDHAVPTHAVVLAGGLGTRLAPYTLVLPKPLLPVGGRPILELVVRRLRRQGIRRFTFAVSHLEELIRAFFGDGRKLEVEIDYLREEKPMGTVGALALIPDLPDPCLVINGDVLATVDIRAMVALHVRTDSAMTVVAQQREVNIDYGVLEIDDESLVTGYQEKPSLHYTVSAGVNLVGKRARQQLVAGQPCDVPTLVTRLIEAGERVAAYRSTAYWRDIGRAADYESANQDFESIRAEFDL